jgi:peroxiredoxin Q/BCP
VLAPGDLAPSFEGISHDGQRVSLDKLRGRVVVVYFFPKAFTPGCTVETKGFRDNYPELRDLGAEVIELGTAPSWADRHARLRLGWLRRERR